MMPEHSAQTPPITDWKKCISVNRVGATPMPGKSGARDTLAVHHAHLAPRPAARARLAGSLGDAPALLAGLVGQAATAPASSNAGLAVAGHRSLHLMITTCC